MGYIRNILRISINIYNVNKRMSRNKEHRRNGAAAEGGPPNWGRLCVICFSSFIVWYYEYLWIFLIYSLYISYWYVLNIFLCSLFLLIHFLILWIFMDIPYIFLIYSMYIYIYIYVLNSFHIFSFVWFVIYSVISQLVLLN